MHLKNKEAKNECNKILNYCMALILQDSKFFVISGYFVLLKSVRRREEEGNMSASEENNSILFSNRKHLAPK